MVFVWILLGLVVGVIAGIVLMRVRPMLGLKNVESKVNNILKDAETKANNIIHGAEVEAKSFTYEMKQNAEKEIKEMKVELVEIENKLNVREDTINRRDNALLVKEENLENKLKQLNEKTEQLNSREYEINMKSESVIKELERVASLTVAEAKKELFRIVEEKTINETTLYIKNKEEEARLKANDTAKQILSVAIEKFSQEVAAERTVSTVSLPNDELKGRIIGREGRNIRTIEQLTGVDLIIDDTPEVITVSCFDPIRRETAKIALENLIKDGRIQPGRIEEVVEKAKEEVNESIMKAGEDAIFQLGISRMSNEMIQTIGKLKYRTSYGQNALKHSMEVAFLTGIMAVELGLDQNLGRRAGLLHDIGKALDFEVEGSHVELGARLAKKYNESPIVINAIESHHGDVEATNVYSHLVSAADTLSAARPGARSETLENYIKRVEKLEELSKSFDGVSQSYAIQAGREIRVMVIPEKVDDLRAFSIARELKDKIENELTYPGQIKVTVIRETRASEVAK